MSRSAGCPTSLLVIGCLAILCSCGGSRQRGGLDGTIVVPLEHFNATRPGRISDAGDIAKILFSGPPIDRLSRRGVITVDNTEFAILLPDAETWPIVNTGPSDDDLSNKSTLVSIDANRD